MADKSSTPSSSDAAAAAPEADANARRRKRQLIGAGIGSAAIVAALLYASRGRRNDRGGSD